MVRQKEFLEKTVVTLKNQLNQVEFYISEANHFYHQPATWQTDSNQKEENKWSVFQIVMEGGSRKVKVESESIKVESGKVKV